jgi:hypothetical protein
MSYQIQIQKELTQTDFLTSTIYERNDLSNAIQPGEKFMVRQGDLIVTNYHIENYEKRGLSKAYLPDEDGIYIFRRTHYIIPQRNQTILVHPEHGVTVIPKPFHSLKFYTFNNAGD